MHNLNFKQPEPEQLKVILLTPADIDACFQLQNSVIERLPPDNKHYLREKKIEDFSKHFADGGKIIGVKENGTLVAMARLSFPKENDQKNYPDMDLTETALIGGVAVWKTGYNLSVIMLEFAKAVAEDHGCHAIAGKVAWSNGISDKQFRKAGFEIAAEGEDKFNDLNYSFVCFRWPISAPQ